VIIVPLPHQQQPHQVGLGGCGGVSPSGSREPDSGISSARSTGTVPWSHNEVGLPVLQVANIDGGGEEQRLEEHQL
jgi:hypothetical protein